MSSPNGPNCYYCARSVDAWFRVMIDNIYHVVCLECKEEKDAVDDMVRTVELIANMQIKQEE